MTIKKLKEIIKDLPDDMRVYADDGINSIFDDNSEFVDLFTIKNNEKVAILQTKKDFDVAAELEAQLNYAADIENEVDEQDFWTDFSEWGYSVSDFANNDQREYARTQLENYGLN